MPNPKYVPKKTIAERWSISERSIDRLIAAGKLKAFKVGGSVRLDAAEVEAALTANVIGQQP